jgi:DNA modification methylase
MQNDKPRADREKVNQSLTTKSLFDLRVEYSPVCQLKPNPRNSHTHSPKNIRQIADSIKTFGFTVPILIDRDGRVIAGHGRLEGAKLLGIEQVPTICLRDLSEAQKHAYIIADNKLAEKAGWDQELLARELSYISELDLDFDLTITGFETAEIDLLLDASSQKIDSQTEEPYQLDRNERTVSRLGDLWILKRHRLLCGDSTNPETFKRLLDGDKAQMVFVDAPYNVPIDGNVSGLGKVKHRDFAMAVGEMSEAEFTEFLHTVFRLLVEHSSDGSIHFVCMDWRHMWELLGAGRQVYRELKNVCVWAKENGGMGSLYRSQHELIFVFKHGHGAHINNVELGRHGRNRSNIWRYPGASSFHKGRLDELAMHPTMKPVAMIADAILDCSKRGAIVLDPFGGSGSTLIAAEKTSRRAYIAEIAPAFVDATIRRFQKLTRQDAVHATTDKTFAAMELERAGENTSTAIRNDEPERGESHVK